jgi:antirestriction protein ArdC
MERTDAKTEMALTLEKAEAGLRDMIESGRFTAWLDMLAKFHSYSLNNVELIYWQSPEATQVAGYRTWQTMGRQVRKGEKAIRILAPMTAKNDDDVTVIIGFRFVNVFDIAQTDGDPLPDVVRILDAGVDGYERLRTAFEAASPFTVTYGNAGGANGWCEPTTGTIMIGDSLPQAQTLKTLAHEIAHARLHKAGQGSQATREIEAEATAYTVCAHFGIDTSDYSFGYMAGWGMGMDGDEIMGVVRSVQTEAKKMIDEISKVLYPKKGA